MGGTSIKGDCNAEVPKILDRLPAGHRFVLCFVDPDGYMYNEGGMRIPEFTPSLLDTVGAFPRTELLMTLPLEIRRAVGYALKRPQDPKTKTFIEGLESTLGKECLRRVSSSYEPYYVCLLEYTLERFFKPYRYKGALLVKSIEGTIQYYLVFGTNNETAGTIMRNIMKKEWEDQYSQKVTQIPPLDNFIFDDRIFRPRLELNA